MVSEIRDPNLEVTLTSSYAVSIIVCTHNRPEYLRRTLHSMMRLSIPADLRTELLIVINGATDYETAVKYDYQFENLDLVYAIVPKAGKCHAHNVAFAKARGQIFLFTDDDVCVPTDWVERMCRPIVDGEADAIQGSIRMAPDLVRPWMRDLHRSWLLDVDCSNVQETGGLIGANMAFDRKVLRKVAGFDELLGPAGRGCCEDSLFGAQLLTAGFKIRSAGPVFVEHHFDPARLERNSLLARAKEQGRSSAYFAYHWQHLEIQSPLVRALIYRVFLTIRRLPYLLWPPSKEGAPDWELSLIEKVYWNFQYQQDCSQPRRYSKWGLKLLDTVQSVTAS